MTLTLTFSDKECKTIAKVIGGVLAGYYDTNEKNIIAYTKMLLETDESFRQKVKQDMFDLWVNDTEGNSDAVAEMYTEYYKEFAPEEE